MESEEGSMSPADSKMRGADLGALASHPALRGINGTGERGKGFLFIYLLIIE